jgi:hypothetical protein
MPPNLSLTDIDPNNRAELLAHREILDVFIARASATSQVDDGDPRSTGPAGAAAFAEELWSRIGKNIRLLAIAAVSFEEEFTLVDLAERLGGVAETLGERLHKEPTLERVKGMWNGKLVPTANRARTAVPGAPEFKRDAYNDGELWHFTIDPEAREAIRQLELAAQYFEARS